MSHTAPAGGRRRRRGEARAGAPRAVARADIQGMRALAVGLVILYHLRPDVLPGGFVGVDVFFVLSGFLIIGSLSRELLASGRVGLTAFYARRIRRLLPASTLVIVTTVVACLVVLPMSRWRSVLSSALASALQVQNWALAFGPDEYAQATADVSPFQHFWSLAVEEQFYLTIPLLMLVVGLLARRRPRALVPSVLVLVGLTFAASLAWSVVYTGTDQGAAYFATTTRAWELAIGGLVAVGLGDLRPPALVRYALGAVGLAAIVFAAVVFDVDMGFPGSVALIPTLGTALLLVAGAARDHVGVSRLLAIRPAVYVGDISYSLYLWHWPLIVLTLAAVPSDDLGWPVALGVVVLAVGLAAASTRWVEEPVRRGSRSRTRQARHGRLRRPARRSFALGGALVGLSVVTALVPLAYVDQRVAQATVAVTDADHPGALVFENGSAAPGVPVLPDPIVASADVPLVARDGCIDADITLPRSDWAANAVTDASCRYGDPRATESIVLVGDSHAAMMSTPLARIAERHGDRLTVLVRNGCPFNLTPPSDGAAPIGVCGERNARNLDLILRERPDLVVVMGMTPYGYDAALGWGWEDAEAAVAGYRDTLRPIADAGIEVVVLRDIPYPPFVGPECVERAGPDSPRCSFPRASVARQRDPIVEAASTLPGVTVVDLTDAVCGVGTCRAVEGNVLVYRDNHLTDTYAVSLEPRLERELGLG